MVAAVACGGDVVAVHRTYLAEPGVKAAVERQKAMLGPTRGGAVPLSRGSGPLVVAEGIETSLSLLDALTTQDPRVWAALSAPGMASLQLPPAVGGIGSVGGPDLVIAPDGDAPGEEAAAKLAERASAAGWRVRIMDCPSGCDWNDAAREVAA